MRKEKITWTGDHPCWICGTRDAKFIAYPIHRSLGIKAGEVPISVCEECAKLSPEKMVKQWLQK